MRNFEILTQFIVPLIFMVIWAVTNMLNRDGQPLPRRPMRPGEGARGGGRPLRRDSEPAVQAASPSQRTEAASRPRRNEDEAFESQPPRRPERGPIETLAFEVDGKLVMFDPNTGRPVGVGKPLDASPRPSSRGKRKAAKGDRREASRNRPQNGDEETQRALSEQIGQSMDKTRGQGLSQAHLTSTLTQLTSASLKNTASIAATVRSHDAPPALSAEDVRRMMASSARLREMAVLTELLQPPVSLRRLRQKG